MYPIAPTYIYSLLEHFNSPLFHSPLSTFNSQLSTFFYFFLPIDLLFLKYLLNPRHASPMCTNVGSPPLTLRLILYPSGSSRQEVRWLIHFPVLINRSYSFPFGLVYDLLRPCSVWVFHSPSTFCLACCCFFFKIPILLVLAISTEQLK